MMIAEVLIVLLICVAYYVYDRKLRFPREPPGPFRWPIIGNLHLQCYKETARIVEENQQAIGTPVITLAFGPRKIYVCNSPEANQAIKSGVCGGRFTTAAVFGEKSSQDGFEHPHWWKHKRMLQTYITGPTPSLRHDTVFFNLGQKLVSSFQQHVKANEMFDPSPYLTSTVFSAGTELLLGKSFGPSEKILDLFAEKSMLTRSVFNVWERLLPLIPSGWLRAEIFKKTKETCWQYEKILRNYYEHIFESFDKSKKITNYVEALLKKRAEMIVNNDGETPRFLEDDIIFYCSYLVVGGAQYANVTLLRSIIFKLASLPEWQAKIYAEVSKIPTIPVDFYIVRRDYPALFAVVQEGLRFIARPDNLELSRVVLKDTSVCGYTLYKGSGIQMNVWALHHNPNVWENPEKFDPNRFFHPPGEDVPQGIINERNGWFTPFGSGPRKCIAQHWSEELVCCVLGYILKEFRIVEYSKSNGRGFIKVVKSG
eukprot:40129_1